MKPSNQDTEQMNQYNGSVNFDVKLKVKLPNKAKSNNATEVNGTTYIWDLTKVKDVKLSFTLDDSGTNTVLIIGGGCALAAIVICGCALVLSKKKNKKVEI